jgi:hypothetical protein
MASSDDPGVRQINLYSGTYLSRSYRWRFARMAALPLATPSDLGSLQAVENVIHGCGWFTITTGGGVRAN